MTNAQGRGVWGWSCLELTEPLLERTHHRDSRTRQGCFTRCEANNTTMPATYFPGMLNLTIGTRDRSLE